MGWTGTYKVKGQSILDFFSQEFNYTNVEGRSGKVIACSAKFTEAYLAYQISYDDPTIDDIVIGIVCMIDYRKDIYYNFYYKDMDESAGPVYNNCPEKILDLLTPTDNENALSWRKSCRDLIAKKKAFQKEWNKIQVNDLINFEQTIKFNNGREFDSLILQSKRPLRFVNPDNPYGSCYRITLDSLRFRYGIESVKKPSLIGA